MKKILIIDDDRPLAELLGMFLTTFGYPPPVYAGDGNDGLFVLIQENIGVIFTDLEMPNMDGETFIKNYRNSTQAFARVILMSGQFSPNDDFLALAKQYNVDAVLSKPFLPHRVLDALTIAGIRPNMFK